MSAKITHRLNLKFKIFCFSVHLDSLKCDLDFMAEVVGKVPSLSCLVGDSKQPPKGGKCKLVFRDQERMCWREQPWPEIRMMWGFFT